MSEFISSISDSTIHSLCDELLKNNSIQPEDYKRFDVKKGLRNSDGTGVMAGLTKICSVEGYYIDDGERVPREGRLFYRGINMSDIVKNCKQENRFGFEEVVWLLLFGDLPTKEQLDAFTSVLAQARELPDEFIEDIIMKAPSRDIMNKVASSVLGLYTFDENPDECASSVNSAHCSNPYAYVLRISGKAQSVRPQEYVHSSKQARLHYGGVDFRLYPFGQKIFGRRGKAS